MTAKTNKNIKNLTSISNSVCFIQLEINSLIKLIHFPWKFTPEGKYCSLVTQYFSRPAISVCQRVDEWLPSEKCYYNLPCKLLYIPAGESYWFLCFMRVRNCHSAKSNFSQDHQTSAKWSVHSFSVWCSIKLVLYGLFISLQFPIG